MATKTKSLNNSMIRLPLCSNLAALKVLKATW